MKDDLKKTPLYPDLQSKIGTKSNNKKSNRDHLYIERDLLTSKAWLELPPGIAPQVYLLFLDKRVMAKTTRRQGGKLICTNNGELQFTYKTAKELGITAPKFTRAIDILMKHGFIDIAEPGNSATREHTKFALDKKWRDYDKPEFVGNTRERAKRGGSKDPFGHKKRADKAKEDDCFKSGRLETPDVSETALERKGHIPEEPAARTTTNRCGGCLHISTQECPYNLRRSAALQRHAKLRKLDECREACDAFEKAPS